TAACGDDADRAWPERQRPLARRIEQALGGQALFELFERQLHAADAARLERVDHELQIAARFVHADAAVGDDFEPVAQAKRQRALYGAEHHRRDLAAPI